MSAELKDLTQEEIALVRIALKCACDSKYRPCAHDLLGRAFDQIERQQKALAEKDAEITRLRESLNPLIESCHDAGARAIVAESELATLKGRTCETCKHWVPFDRFTESPWCAHREARFERTESCSAHAPKEAK